MKNGEGKWFGGVVCCFGKVFWEEFGAKVQIIGERGVVFGYFFVPLQIVMVHLKRYILLMALGLANLLVAAQEHALVDTLSKEKTQMVSDVNADTLAEELPIYDSISVSILTCTPGMDLYAKFGHTALRVKNHTLQKDVVFNYGCFDGSANDFVFKFLLGQTDYLLEAEPYDYLVARYGYMGTGVKEQVLNLTQEEANHLLFLLLENIQPQNQEYRYIWLYDNCTERARDMVERAVNGKVVYERAATDATIRQMLHQCLEKDPWICFGIDMILGAEIDQPADRRIQMFLPDFFSAEAEEALIEKVDGSQIPYIAQTNNIIERTKQGEATPFLLSPLFAFSLLLVGAVLLFVYEWKKKEYQIGLDVPLHIAQGLAGIIVAFLFFFSSHPAVDSNWLVVILNPIALFYAGWLVYCKKKRKKNLFSYVNLAVFAGFLAVMMACPQSFNPSMYLVVLVLLVRALSQAHFTYHSKG